MRRDRRDTGGPPPRGRPDPPRSDPPRPRRRRAGRWIGRPQLRRGEGDHNIRSGRVLAGEGRDACVELARRHAMYPGLDADLVPRTAEEKLVYVADRRGGQVVKPLEERARDTARRNPGYATEIERAIPLAKAIEHEGVSDVSFAPEDLEEKVRGT